MKKHFLIVGLALGMALGATLMSASAFAQGEYQGQGQFVVTVLPKHDGDTAPEVAQQSLKLKVNGKDASVSGWTALRGADNVVELAILIDGSARTSLGRQLDEISHFVQTLPPNIHAAIGYMQNGNAVMTGPFTTDRTQTLRGLHIPAGAPGSNGSPYFCLSDLAKRWPASEHGVRREVLMITDGVDEYNRRYDPDDPYVQTAISDAARARLVVFSIYWRNQGIADNTRYANDTGQNLLVQVTESTGGKSFWQGTGNPVTFEPYFDELTRRLRNQYELSFTAPFKGKSEVADMKLKFSAPGSEINAPQRVFVVRPGTTEN